MTRETVKARIAKARRTKKRRLAVLLACAIMLASVTAYHASMLYREYLAYTSLHRIERHDMASLDKPACLMITLQYPEHAPSGIAVKNDVSGRPVRDISVYDDPSARTVLILCDIGPDDLPGDFVLECRPMGADALEYRCEATPSYRHIDGHVEFYTGPDGHMLADVYASYERAMDPEWPRVSVRLKGQGYEPRLYDGHVDGRATLDLTKLAQEAGADLSKADTIAIDISAEYMPYQANPNEEQDIRHARLSATVALDGFPAEKDTTHDE